MDMVRIENIKDFIISEKENYSWSLVVHIEKKKAMASQLTRLGYK